MTAAIQYGGYIGHLNLKWSIADTDRVAAWARAGWSANDICNVLDRTPLASRPAEIINLCNEMGVFIQTRGRRK